MSKINENTGNNIVIAGKTLRFSFNMADWERMEDEICTIDYLDKKLQEKGRIRVVYKLVAMMAHDDLVTEDWLALNMKPFMLRPIIRAINGTIIASLTRQEDPAQVHDVILDELQKKAGEAV